MPKQLYRSDDFALEGFSCQELARLQEFLRRIKSRLGELEDVERSEPKRARA